MRLFIALDLDDDARTAIAIEQKRLGEALRARSASPVKWVPPEQMHLTLVFLGEIEDERVPSVRAAACAPIAQPPFELAFEGLGMFPSRGRPTVLWLGAGRGADAAIQMQQTIRERVERVGVAVETRPFHPHLTLARWRDSRDRDRSLAAAAARPHVLARVYVDHATLYHSRLGPAGAAYTALARATLTA